MKSIRKHGACILMIIATTNNISAQENVPYDTSWAAAWKAYAVPRDHDTLQYFTNNSKDYWTVVKGSRGIGAINDKEYEIPKLPFELEKSMLPFPQGRMYTQEVPDGYLIALNAGEGPGSVWWYAIDGKEHYQISNHRVRQFIVQKDKICAVAGLAHKTSDEGCLLTINRNAGRWKADTLANLGSEPLAVTTDTKGVLCVVTSKALLKVDAQGHIDTLIAAAFWHKYLYPTSLVFSGNVVYIGMIQGVYRFDTATKKDAWLMPLTTSSEHKRRY